MFDAGVRAVTHLFNAMSQLDSRDPGVVGAVLADPRVICGLIADGEHAHPAAYRAAIAAKGPDRRPVGQRFAEVTWRTCR